MDSVECIFFDLDNTLLDFDTAQEHALKSTLTTFDLPYSSEVLDLYRQLNNTLWAQLETGEMTKEVILVERFKRLFENFDGKIDPASLNSSFLNDLVLHSKPYVGAEDLIKSLAKKFELGIITNGDKVTQRRRMANTSLGEHFKFTLVSDDIGVAKPNPQIFAAAFEKVSVDDKQKVLYIGDSIKADIEGAQNFGFRTGWHNRTGKSYPGERQPDFEYTSIEQLRGILH
jgi:YjjG family noncanonical pyrimidine nucleotidase